MILTVCMSPCIDVSVELDALNVGKTNIAKGKEISLGGKAINVAIGAKRLGAQVYATGIMYNENGELFERALEKEGIRYGFVSCEGRVRENYKFIDRKAMLTEVNDVAAQISKQNADEVLKRVAFLSRTEANVTVISGSLPRGLSSDYYGKLVGAISENSLRIIDANGNNLLAGVREGVDLVKPNAQELENTLGVRLKDAESLKSACKELIIRGARMVLLSLGEDGAVITDGDRFYHCKSINVAVNSTVGAGDAMVAAVATRIRKGSPLPELLRAGVSAGTARISTIERVSFSKKKSEEIYKKLKVTEF